MNLATIAMWALKILTLVPIIANGVHQTHADLTLEGKDAAAQDALGTAIAGSAVLLPESEQPLAQQIGQIAAQSLSQTLSVLHNAKTPVPAA